MHDNMATTQQHIEHGLSMAAVKTSPPVLVSGLTFLGVHIQDWLILLTIIYTLIMIVISLPKLKQSFSEWRNK